MSANAEPTGMQKDQTRKPLTVRILSAHNESVSLVAKMYIVVPRCSFSSAMFSIVW